MILKRRVSLGGKWLDELDNRILITGIDEAAGKDNFSATNTQARSGQRITKKRRDTLDVTVKFALNIRNDDMAGRSELLEEVNAWAAKGGWLRLNYRPDRRLQVVLVQAPGEGDLFNWGNEFTMVFRAFRVPYWENDEAVSASSNVTSSGTFYIDVPGSAETVMDITVKNESGMAINNVKVKAGDNEMTFSGTGILTATGSLVVDHGGNKDGLFYLRAKVGSTSVLKNREGADDFYVNPGNVKITFTADRAVKVTASVRGRFL